MTSPSPDPTPVTAAPIPAARTPEPAAGPGLPAYQPSIGAAGWTPLPRPPLNGFAVASLLLGLIGGIFLSVVFAVVALSQIRNRGHRGKRLAIAGLVLSGLWAAGIATAGAMSFAAEADRDGAGTVTGRGTVSVPQLRPGDCLVDLGDGTGTEELEAVPCAEPHRVEVFATFDVSGDGYPGRSALANEANAECAERLPGYSPRAADDAAYTVVYQHPTQESWERGGRTVTCMVVTRPHRNGSVRD